MRTYLSRFNGTREDTWASFPAMEQASTCEGSDQAPFKSTALMVCETPWTSLDDAPPNTPTMPARTRLRFVTGFRR